MWYVLSKVLPFCFGLIFGIVLMCSLQIGKEAKEAEIKIEKMERKKEK